VAAVRAEDAERDVEGPVGADNAPTPLEKYEAGRP
jgi:hypothetical protein